MRLDYMQRYRPTRVDDTDGGFTETLGDPTTLYGALIVNDVGVRLTYRTGTDLVVEDLVVVNGEQYRVMGHSGKPGARFRVAELERSKRPITGT